MTSRCVQDYNDERGSDLTIKSLETRNAQLEAEIEKLHDSANTSIQPRRGRSGGPTNAGLQAQVKRLKGEVEALKKVRTLARSFALTVTN